MQFPDDWREIWHSPVIVGIAGAVVGLRFSVAATLPGKAWQVLTGALIAAYVGPALVGWIGMTDRNVSSGVNFVTGVYGVVIASSVNSWLKEIKLSDLLPMFKRKGDQ